MSADELLTLVNSFDQDDQPNASTLIALNNGNIKTLPEELVQASIKCLLDIEFRFPVDSENSLSLLFSAHLWTVVINALTDTNRRYMLESPHRMIRRSVAPPTENADLLSRQIQHIYSCARKLLAPSSRDSAQRLSDWTDLVECLTEYYGQSMLANELSVMAGCIRAGRQGGVRGLFDAGMPLVARTRYAKSQLNRTTWWREQSLLIETDYDRNLWLLCLYAWASPSVILELINEIEKQLNLFTEANRTSTVEAARRSSDYSPRSRVVFDKKQSASLRRLRDPATIYFLYDRIDRSVISDLLLKNVEPNAYAAYMGNIILDFTGKSLATGGISNETALKLMKHGYNLGADGNCGLRPRTRRANRSIGAQLAIAVLEDSWNMPADVLMTAQNIVDDSKPNPEPVMRIAEREGWFGADI